MEGKVFHSKVKKMEDNQKYTEKNYVVQKKVDIMHIESKI